MKVSKEAHRAARLLFKATTSNGALDAAKVKEFTARMIAEKPRHYIAILEQFKKLLRIEIEKRHVVIESAEALNGSLRDSLLQDLATKFGSDLTSEFKVNPDLIGGLRIKVGSDIWDGSVRSRLDALRLQFAA
jgi:F-type H+-transporting ATPase subunit delta